MPHIKSISRIRALGVFEDYSHPAELANFRRYNLIYGFNGSGKTTLSRILRCVERGAYCEHFPLTAQFTVHFDNDSIASHETVRTAGNDHIVVFNSDFVDDNLRWRDGRVSPVFFIGENQARLAHFEEKLMVRATARDVACKKAEAKRDQIANAFAAFKRDAARTIAETLNVARRYNAATLDQDMVGFVPAASMLLNEEALGQKKSFYYSTSAGAKIAPIGALRDGIVTLLNRVRTHCAATFSGAVIQALKDHAAMLKWAKDGLDYHRAHSLAECLFCGNPLTDDRVDLLQKSIDDRFTKSINETISLQEQRKQFLDAIDGWWAAVPAVSSLNAEFIASYRQQHGEIERLKEELRRLLIAVRETLEAKASTPNLSVPVPAENIEKAEAIVTALDKAGTAANSYIIGHNDKIDRFTEEKENAALAIKRHLLAGFASDYHAHSDDLRAAEGEVNLRARLARRAQLCSETVRQQLRQHAPAVAPINRLLAAYLGHSDLALVALDVGYQIERRGSPIKGPPSEGEKTAISICYFLSKLNENGRQRKDLIAVIDDPISSLDTKALNYALSLLKTALSEAAQVFIFTHNLQFMNETKKWLKPLARTEANKPPPTAALYFLEARVDTTGRRVSTIGALPKLLRDYDSEYHYLCSLVFAFTSNEAANEHLGYILPNVMRKVLELFLTFKAPGPEGLDDKLSNSPVKDCGLDPARIRALSRLIQVESHGDSLDDLVALSSMTIEETRDAANALFALMEMLDGHHFKRMKRLCR